MLCSLNETVDSKENMGYSYTYTMVSFDNFVLNKGSQLQKANMMWFHLHEVWEQTKLISSDRSQMVIFQGVPLTGEWHKGAARMLKLLSAVGSCPHVTMYQTLHLRYFPCVSYPQQNICLALPDLNLI